MQRRRMLAFAVVYLATAVANHGVAQDWPQWRGPNRDAKATDFDAPETWPEELTRRWQVAVGDGVATPALVGNRLYVFTLQDGNEILRCLDASTGEEIWQSSYPAEGAVGPAGSYAGPRSSPTVAEGKVVTYGVRGMLSCLDAENGEVLWRSEEPEDSLPNFYTSSSPIVADGLCVAQRGGEEQGAIVAYDLQSGEERWKWAEDGTAYSSPVLATVDGTDVILAETDDQVVGLRLADGTLLWQAAYPVPGRGYNAATPIVHDQTLILTGSNRGAKALQLEKRGDRLEAQELWTNEDNSVQFNTPVLKDGLLFGLSNRDVLFCIDAQTGQTAWTAQIGVEAGGEQRREQPQRGGRGRRGGRGGGPRPGFGTVVDAGAVLLVLHPSGQLVVVEPTAEEFKQVASYKVADQGANAYPIATGNRIYIKDQDSVALWTVE